MFLCTATNAGLPPPDGGVRPQPLETLHSLKTGEHLLRSGGEWKNEWKTVTRGVLMAHLFRFFVLLHFRGMIKMRVISSGHKSMNTPQIRATHEPAAQGVGGWGGAFC